MAADPYNKLARILRTTPEALLALDEKMSAVTGQEGVMEAVVKENDIVVDRILAEFGLTRRDTAQTVYDALVRRLVQLDKHLDELLDRSADHYEKMCEAALKVYTPPQGLFIRREKVAGLLEKYPPENMLKHFGYGSVAELLEKEGFSSVVSALRFTQPEDWMHQFFDQAYAGLTKDDFQERQVELVVLDKKWLQVAEKFMEKKYHNVSHLKEFGVIFMIPLPNDEPGEMLRTFTLMLHYLHEVPFYASLIRKFMDDADFAEKFTSLLRGDVPSAPLPDHGKTVWRVVQRYLAKNDENDPRLLEQHVNPEAEHWLRAEEDLGRLSRMMGAHDGHLDLGFWTGLDFVGDFFKDAAGREQLVSFGLIDLIMSLVTRGEVKFLYHQQEALWNKLFSEYMGREQMDRLVEENIIKGFIEL